MPRLKLILLVCFAALIFAPAKTSPWPTNGWASSTAEALGLDGKGFQDLDREIRSGDFGYIDRMLVVKDGFLIVNHHYSNDYKEISRGVKSQLGCGYQACSGDAARDEYNYLYPDFHPFYKGGSVHTLQSVTKSVSATVIGVAIQQGKLSSLDAPLLSFLQDYDLSKVDPRLHKATLDDLLTMRSGIEWHEQDRPLGDSNTTIQLERSDDWVQFTLNQPMDSAPGQKWAYNSGGSHLMSAVVRRATGQTIDDYARRHLFEPLGIRDFHWKKTPRGLPDTEGGLYLEAEQLAKIGYLYLQDGLWDGQRILPPGWAAQATARRVERVNRQGWGYGYQWWRLDRGGVAVWAGLGFGGQYLLILPQRNLIGVVNSWNIFGGNRRSILGAFLDALLESVSG